ncbi:MAG: response regulator, partial [Deltaproteobacteria bacterium]|nr:response regulator [Deltaproteobacteria bacterium]
IVNYMGIIDASVQKASQTVSHLLSFARKGEFQSVPLNMNSLIDFTITMVSKLIQKNVTIKKELIEPLPHVIGDAIQLEQVLMNLIVNARDAMPGGGEISIKTSVIDIEKRNLNIRATLRSGEYVNIAVSDTGTGIAREHISHVFDPFYTTKAKDQGTGLGLAIVYGIIKEHGGYITVDSVVGQGTVFNIYLPVSRMTIKTRGEERIVQYKRPVTILVVDDEIYVLEALRKTLLKSGFIVEIYDNPLKCLDFFKSNHEKIDLVILDLIMPEMHGLELRENILRIKPDTRIIFMTGFPDIDSIPECDFLRKPFKPSTVLDMIERTTNNDTKEVSAIEGGLCPTSIPITNN